MEAGASSRELIQEVLKGENRALQLLAADGMLPLEPSELILLELSLRRSLDTEIGARALRTLRETDPRLLAEFARSATSHDFLTYLSQETGHRQVVEAVLARRELDPALLVNLASSLPEELQEMLFLRQDDLRQHPEILDAFEVNPALSAYSRRMIAEYRQHLVVRERHPDRARQDVQVAKELEERDSSRREEIEEAVRELPESSEDGEGDGRSGGLSEVEIRALNVGLRTKLTFGASRSLRAILIRDNNPLVAVGALKNGTISELEVEQICNARNILPEVLAAIAGNRRWLGRYGVLVAVVRNPLTPDGLALRLLPRLAVKDLRALSLDRSASQAIRTLARRTYVHKTH